MRKISVPTCLISRQQKCVANHDGLFLKGKDKPTTSLLYNRILKICRSSNVMSKRVKRGRPNLDEHGTRRKCKCKKKTKINQDKSRQECERPRHTTELYSATTGICKENQTPCTGKGKWSMRNERKAENLWVC
jgi:hypothetical protein